MSVFAVVLFATSEASKASKDCKSTTISLLTKTIRKLALIMVVIEQESPNIAHVRQRNHFIVGSAKCAAKWKIRRMNDSNYQTNENCQVTFKFASTLAFICG
jgi:hypothetical protein